MGRQTDISANSLNVETFPVFCNIEKGVVTMEADLFSIYIFRCAVLVLVTFAETSAAQDRPITLNAYFSDNNAIVWVDADSEARGMAIIDAGANKANPWLLAPLIACVVSSGTGIVVVGNPAWFGFDPPTAIEVIDGPSAGCSGTVPILSISFPSGEAPNPTSGPPLATLPEATPPVSAPGDSLYDSAQSTDGMGPSFSCSKGTHADEIAVCQSRELSGLDRKLASLFDEAKRSKSPTQVAGLERSETKWLSSRRSCGAVLSCLFGAYSSRIVQLSP